jgi:hypothetical protein
MHATIQTIKQCPWDCLQFPGYCRSREFTQFPGNFRETVWEPALGPGQPARHVYLFCYSDYSQTTQTWLHGLRAGGGLVPLAICTEHNNYVRYPGLFPETSRKRPGGPGGGALGDEDGCTGRAKEGAQDAGGLAAGWSYLARSLTVALTATAPSGLEFETRDGSHSGAVATGRQGLDGAGTGWLCSLLQDFCGGLLLLALAQGSIPASIPLPARPLAHRLAVTQPARDRIWTRPRVGRKCPLQATYSSH